MVLKKTSYTRKALLVGILVFSISLLTAGVEGSTNVFPQRALLSPMVHSISDGLNKKSLLPEMTQMPAGRKPNVQSTVNQRVGTARSRELRDKKTLGVLLLVLGMVAEGK